MVLPSVGTRGDVRLKEREIVKINLYLRIASRVPCSELVSRLASKGSRNLIFQHSHLRAF